MTSLRALALGLAVCMPLTAGALRAQPAPDAPDTTAPGAPGEAGTPPPASPEQARPSQTDAAPAQSGAAREDAAPSQPAAAAPSPAPEAPAPVAPAAEATPPAAPPTPAPVAAPLDPKDVKLRVATAGGAYLKSQELAYFRPFAKRTGYTVSGSAADRTLAALKSAAGAPQWDVLDLDLDVAARACEDGLLEPLDAALLQPAPDGGLPAEDFIPGAIGRCSVGGMAWSAVIVYDKALKAPPTRAEHLLDVKKYPGKRSLPRTPEHTLELALLADGVAPAEVYATLATKEGQDRAFARLTAIKDQIVWWDRAADAVERVGPRQAAMGLAFNGRAFQSIVKGRHSIALLWDHQIYHLNHWAIPKGAKHLAQAREFIGFATSPGPLADQTRWLPYGPARRSAAKLAGKHAELNLDMKPYLPTHQPNFQGALAFDARWWAQQQGLRDRFAAWVAGRELPAAEAATSQ